jgi:hypothetical protein
MSAYVSHTLLPTDPAPAPQPPPAGSRAWYGFYLGAPLIGALPMGWYGAGIGAELSRGSSMLLWVSVCWLSWVLSDALARLLARMPGATLAPPWLLLCAGYLLNLLLSSVYNPAVLQWLLRMGLGSETPAITEYFDLERSLLDPAYLWLLLIAGLPGLLVWLAGNYALERIAAVPRFSHPDPRPAASPPAPPAAAAAALPTLPGPAAPMSPSPRFFERLERLQGLRTDELVAVEAEDHYIQVHSLRGKELVYYRFRDALTDLATLDGLQIHRSAWVSRRGIQSVQEQGRVLGVLLVTGETLRASQSYKGALAQSGFRARPGRNSA